MKPLQFKRKKETAVPKVFTQGDVPYLYFQNLKDTKFIKHGFSTRLGGVSKDHLGTMNLGFARGDEEENVLENYRRLAGAIGVSYDSLVLSHQTHTVNIRKVTEEDRGKGITAPRDYSDMDGLITNVKGISLVTFYADCVPLLFADPVHRAIGSSHAGWRGTAGKIGLQTVRKMKEEYGTRPEDIQAAVGPSICRDCYEVSQDVADAFGAAFSEAVMKKICMSKGDGKYQLDLWEANRQVLLEAGIPAENIAVTGICTCCNPELLFSHRASGGQRGNLAAVIQINEQ